MMVWLVSLVDGVIYTTGYVSCPLLEVDGKLLSAAAGIVVWLRQVAYSWNVGDYSYILHR